MSEQQSRRYVLPAHQAQTGARFSKYFISHGGTKEKQPDSLWELGISLTLTTLEKKWPKRPTSGQMSFFWKSDSHHQEMNTVHDDKTSQAHLKATRIYSQYQKHSSL